MEEIERYQLDLVGLQETRWPFNGRLNSKSHTLYYSGSDDGNHYAGVGFAIRNNITECVMAFEPVNERLCYLRLKGKFQNISVICMYAPTEEADDDVKNTFYDNIDQLMANIPNYDITILVGDANAKVGRELGWKQYTGCNSLHEITNDNGMRLISLSSAWNLKIVSTSFPRKDIYKATWVSPNGQIRNQIDHILIEERHKSCITDVKSRRGAECGTDHYLIIVKVRQRLCKEKREKQKVRPKVDLPRLDKAETRRDFEIKLANRFEALQREAETEKSIESKWKEIEEVMQEITEQVVGFCKTSRPRKPWFNEECQQMINERRQRKNIVITNDTQENREKYQKANKEVNRMVRAAKRNYIKNQLKKAEEDRSKGNARDFFRTIRYFKQGYKARSYGIKDRNGDVVCNQGAVMEVWRDYFEDLLNVDRSEISEDSEVSMNVQPQTQEPTLKEVEAAIKQLKNNKAPGEDGIAAELIKAGGKPLTRKLHDLIKDIWREEKLPNDWKTAIIVPIHKKGDRSECNNYRGISLLNTTYKVLSKIVEKRFQGYAEEILGDHQAAFRRNRSTTDQLFIIKQAISKYWEFDKSVHILFIDFMKAYDSINRNQMWKCLQQMGIPEKLINLAKACTDESKCKVKVNNELSREFNVFTGVRQGDGLSPLLFNLALERSLQKVKLQEHGIEVGKKINVLAFADDIALLAENDEGLETLIRILMKEAKKVGLEINNQKTKYLRIDRHIDNRRNNLKVDSSEFEDVTEFKYLGVNINKGNNEETEVDSRILNANRCYWSLQGILKSKVLSRKTKERVYRTVIQPVILYGSEIWVITKRTEKRLIVLENKILRRIYGPVNEDGVWRIRTNKELREIYEEPDIVAQIKSRRLRWAGHVARREHAATIKAVSEGVPRGRRPLGRPRLRWGDQVGRDMRRVGAEEGWMQDRERWRGIVGEAKNLLRFEWPNK